MKLKTLVVVLASGLMLLATALSACASAGHQQANSGAYSASRCFVAPNPNACRLQGSLSGAYTNPTINDR